MKILLFTTLYPASDAPTRGTYNQNLWNAVGRHADIRVVGALPWWTRTHRPQDILFVQRESRFGLDAAFPSYFSIPGVHGLHGHAMSLSLAPYLALVHRTFPWDVVVASNGYPDGVGAADIAAVSRAALVQNVIGTDVNALAQRGELRPQIRWALRRAGRVIAVSEDLADRAAELDVPRHRIVAQHNGVDGATFVVRDSAAARRQVGLEHDGPVIVYVGNVRIAKGTKVLVEAMAPLARKHGRGDALLCIVGGGEAEAEVTARVRELGLERTVRFCGRRLHHEVPHWISAADVLCLPSYMEGCPNVVLEALASGRGVVASRVGGIPELVRDGETGVLVPPRDPEALAEGLARALGRRWDPEKQRASVQYLSWDAVAKAYRDHIEAAIEEHRRTPLEAEPR
ncbi:Glycosyl transferase, group 1 family protein [Minicystis rosea]|nr:Glycosyl transferase, group 1 family protein [Minicystis rosea]